jgi:hypothetical protein
MPASVADHHRPPPRRAAAHAAQTEDLLLRRLLTPAQEGQVDAHGWFELPWPERRLVLRVHTERAPAVEAFALVPDTDSGGQRRAYGPRLRAWDLAAAAQRTARRLRLPLPRVSARRYARMVLEVHRRGVLHRLLDSADDAPSGDA